MFRVIETYGIPIDLMISELHKNGYVVDWIDFYETSIQYKWNPRTTLSKIERGLIDSMGKKYSDDIMIRLKIYITMA